MLVTDRKANGDTDLKILTGHISEVTFLHAVTGNCLDSYTEMYNLLNRAE